jgi:RNA polymerase sigma factor (sigma-70 family)
MPPKQDVCQRLTEEEQEIVASNTGLIGFAIKKVGLIGNLIEDQFQDGAIALMGATRNYDESKGYEFSTYATRAIRNALLRNEYQFGAIRIPRDLKCKGKSSPERRAAAKKARTAVSLNEVSGTPKNLVYSEEDDGSGFSYEAMQAAKLAVFDLEPLERDIVESVVMGDESMTDVGERLGIKRWTIRYIKRKAMTKLRDQLQKHV